MQHKKYVILFTVGSKCMLPPGESRRVYTARSIKDSKKTGQKHRRTDARPLHYAYRYMQPT